MKRIFIILSVICVISGVMLLSGCDAILEGFFPEFADSNTINISVYANSTLHDEIDLGYPVRITVVKFTDDSHSNIAESWEEQIYYLNNFDYSFNPLPDGEYAVLVWMELGVGEPHPNNAPRKIANIKDSINIYFNLNHEDEENIVDVECILYDNSDDSNTWIGQL